MKRKSTSIVICIIVSLSFIGPAFGETPVAKNIILMISDGAGFNAFHSASYYQHGELGQQPYDSFPVQLACTTYMLNASDPQQYYDPNDCWSDFNWVKGSNNYTGYTDSSAAATAILTGTKTTKGKISRDRNGNVLTTIAERAKANLKSTGVVTTVPLSHATPACVDAHNTSRYNYEDIADEMIYESDLDVIMGAGHPEYDHLGNHTSSSNYSYIYQATWEELKGDPNYTDWTLIESKADFESIAQGNFECIEEDPNLVRLIGIPQVRISYPYYNSGRIANIPLLKTMTMAAIKTLSQNENGFFLMVEGGAVDWANHRNEFEGMIQEQSDFNDAVTEVVGWIESESSWDETLLIITADHETGMLWGPGTYTDNDANGIYHDGIDDFNDWMLIVNNGIGIEPGHQYGSKHSSYAHTNALVPVYAKGVGCKLFNGLIDGVDTKAGEIWGFSGKYIDNTDFFKVMNSVMRRQADMDGDNDVDIEDLNSFCLRWLEDECDDSVGDNSDWCFGADFDHSNNVDFVDFHVMARNWSEKPVLVYGDLSGDNFVNLLDLAIISHYWMQSEPLSEPLIDIAPLPDGDGVIDIQDLRILADNWLK